MNSDQAVDDRVVPRKEITVSSVPTLSGCATSQQTTVTHCTQEMKEDLRSTIGDVAVSYVMISPAVHNSRTIGILVLLNSSER